MSVQEPRGEPKHGSVRSTARDCAASDIAEFVLHPGDIVDREPASCGRVIYVMVDGMLYINTLESSVKVRNIRQNPRVAVSIPARKLPFFPPFRVQF